MKERRKDNIVRHRLFLLGTICLVVLGGVFLWLATLRIPALEDLSERKVVQSTKIYDRTGTVLLYDFSQDVTRTVVSYDQISDNLKKATVAIEDKDFYSHGGIVVSSIIRAVLVDLVHFSFSQGGSTITQQVIKNTVLTTDKSPTRKLKEWILAIKLEKAFSKDEILNMYLNEIPYGGRIYGAEEASEGFFGVHAKELTLAQAAYIASLAKAPTYYSPYGEQRDELEDRKNLVLKEMLENEFITEDEYNKALAEKVEFKPRTNTAGIKAPHFVFFVIDELAKRYGEEALEQGGFKVITTLDYDIQSDAEDIARKYGESNQKNFNANNNAIVVIDPKTGDILSMVGSRDYFDKEINGNFNVATAHRQPGSTFKPIVYSELFNKGYTTETVLFDVPTQFSTNCPANQFNSDDGCYSPGNYDDNFRGPITIRNALAQSINIPAVKALYLAGIKDSLNLAKSMGIDSLGDTSRFGLSLVLGGGEVSPLDLTSAYSVFANDGVRNPYNPILRVETEQGEVIEEHTAAPTRVLPEESARMISSILTDNVARTPAYGSNSVLYVPDRDVAVKTGTTNDYKDAWIMGYTPNIVVGAWVGNSNNTPMEKKVAGYIVAPLWRELMDKILPKLPVENFIDPQPLDPTLKPVLRGIWQGGFVTTPTIDNDNNNDSNDDDRNNRRRNRDQDENNNEETIPAPITISGGIHNILYWVNKNDPRGPYPSNAASDPQFRNWEYGVQAWLGGVYTGQ